MAQYSTTWLVPEHILEVTVSGNFDLKMIRTTCEQIVSHIDQSHAVHVHVVLNTLNLKSFSGKITDVRNAATFLDHPRLGWLLTYGSQNKVMGHIAYAVTKLAGIRYNRQPSREHILAFLTQSDEQVAQALAASQSQNLSNAS